MTESADNAQPAGEQAPVSQEASSDQQTSAQPADGPGESGEPAGDQDGIWMDTESIRGSGSSDPEIRRDTGTSESRESKRDR
jgi:hypothetical protein